MLWCTILEWGVEVSRRPDNSYLAFANADQGENRYLFEVW